MRLRRFAKPRRTTTDDSLPRRLLGSIALRFALYGALIFGAIFMLQDRLLYFPTAITPDALLSEARASGLQPWPGDGPLRGLLREPSAPARATIALLHGNAGHVGDRAWFAEEMTRLGLRVVLLEYPGFGPREGAPGEAALVADAVESLRLIRARYPGPLLLAGESLGAGVASAVAVRLNDTLSGLLLITPWDKLENVARLHYPWAPVGLVLRDRYDSVAALADYRAPVAVVVAGRDSIVPAALGERLFAALPGRKRLWTVAPGEHNDWLYRVDDRWWAEVMEFLIPPAVHRQNP